MISIESLGYTKAEVTSLRQAAGREAYAEIIATLSREKAAAESDLADVAEYLKRMQKHSDKYGVASAYEKMLESEGACAAVTLALDAVTKLAAMVKS